VKTLLAVMLCLAAALPVLAIDECAGETAALHALYDLRALIIGQSASPYTLGSRLEEHLETLRVPLSGGGYRWVRFVRPKSGSGPVVKREHLIQAVQGSEDPSQFEASADHVYAVKMVVPRKRSLMNANNDAYVGTVRVRYWTEGQERVLEKRVNQWLKPDNSRTWDLDLIADRAEATAEVATKSGTVRQSLAELHFVQAVAQDDPASPFASAVDRLKKLQSDLNPRTIDEEIARLEYQLFGRASTVPLAQVTVALRQAEELMGSKDEKEQEKGRKLLRDTMRLLR
jgi:hypothetical protein